MPPPKSPKKKTPLSRERILTAALRLADRSGIEALSMRKLGVALRVEAMSLYNHFPNKEAILDGLVDTVLHEVPLPGLDDPWEAAMRDRATSVRAMLHRHPWACGLLESRRNPGLATLRYHDAILGCLLQAGFPLATAALAFSTLDAFIYGFTLQEMKLPFQGAEETQTVVSEIMDAMDPTAFPHLVRMATERVLVPGYDFGEEFDAGLELILEGLKRRLPA